MRLRIRIRKRDRNRNRNAGLQFAVVVSLFCHIFFFRSIEFTFDQKLSKEGSEPSKISFLGPILQGQEHEVDYYSQSGRVSNSATSRSRLNAMLHTDTFTLGLESSPIYELSPDFKKPHLVNMIDNKVAYSQVSIAPKAKKTESSIMFYPTMPYHFLLYFKDRQTAHMEVDFYISSKGKVIDLKRKISSGNPEVDLLIMRNLAHFLNVCRSNFALSSSRTVKVDLSP